MQTFDLAIIETNNGGDLQLVGNDLAVVLGIENMIYLAICGGNVEQSTESNVILSQSFDFWGNNLFLKDDPGTWFNSQTERTLNNTALTSNGRVLIENAVKEDLSFFATMGAQVTVSVTIVNVDHVYIKIRVLFEAQQEKIIVINFKKQSDGDFFAPDFNDDFFI